MSRTNPVDVLGKRQINSARKSSSILPKRFKIRNLPSKPFIRIYDSQSGKRLDVSLCDAYGAFVALYTFCQ